jgi:RNA polymerase sigma-70 factor, ECF subfamily
VAADELAPSDGIVNGRLPEAEGDLLARLREGDAEAGHRFVREYYPAVYRCLLTLTGDRESAQDLTQETFLRAWRHLDQFQGRAPLRLWLHQIARRQFLDEWRRQRAATRTGTQPLDQADEIAEPSAGEWTDEAELRVLLGMLPAEQREVVALHDLEGYSSGEIAAILQTPASTVRYRLGAARALLAQELGEGDLPYLNEPFAPMRRWAWLPLEQMQALEARLTVMGVQAFGRSGVQDPTTAGRPLPDLNARRPERLNARSAATKEETMERREFLRQAAVGAAGLMLPEAEKEVVDSRLAQKVSCAFKATALSDLCERLRADTGVHVEAGPSVADEKVTIFCEKLPLREVMRQLSRPFGYAWLRGGRQNAYKYELTQDLRSQLLEEELRNRDRNAALVALEREIERYRPYLGLSQEEVLERSKTAAPDEKLLLENLAGKGWGSGWAPVQMYFKLSRADLEALRAGQTVRFDSQPGSGEQKLPADITRGALQGWWDARLYKRGGVFSIGDAASAEAKFPDALAPASTPEAGALVHLVLAQSELGQFTLIGRSGYFAGVQPGHRDVSNTFETHLAVGKSPATLKPENGATNARLARDPALRARVAIAPGAKRETPDASPALAGRGEVAEPTPSGVSRLASSASKVTSADVLEALHRATGLPIVSDYYTRLYPSEAVTVQGKPVFDTLNSLADAMRMRWSKDVESGWLQFRSASFFHDRLKEVPNRLLNRWAAARHGHGMLTLDDVLEIAQLPDAQLDAEEMAEGARVLFGLAEWDVARSQAQRPHLRYLATFTPAQRQEAMSPTGLPFTRMSLAQQQQFLAACLPADGEGLQSLDELAGAALRVDYQLPGWYEWRPGSWYRWVMPTADGKRVPRLLLRERTREAALEAARRYFPPFAPAMVKAERTFTPGVTEAQVAPQAKDVVPTRLELQITYIPGSSHRHAIVTFIPGGDDWRATWEELGK